MRIVHVTDCYLPRVGGIELHVRDLAARQRLAGHDVTVVTRTPGDPDEGLVRTGGRFPLDGADVVHAHVSVVSPFALVAARRAAYAGVPTLVTVHSLWSHVGPLPELARGVWGTDRWPLTWSAVSERAALPVHERLGVAVHVLPNAVDLDTWTPAPTVPPGVPEVLSVMRLTSVKRAVPLVRVLRSVAERAEFSATVVGDGPERPAVERFLRRHGLTDRVTLTGALDRTAIRAHLERASVFVAPAHRESFGIAALEARATGVPVLASARSGVATFVEHERDGLLARDDRELADHLHTLVTDHALRHRIARHNRLVPPAHGWAQALARTEELYAVAGARTGVRA
jgi:glycosyltransferase involved in cell wall biosynthesis